MEKWRGGGMVDIGDGKATDGDVAYWKCKLATGNMVATPSPQAFNFFIFF